MHALGKPPAVRGGCECVGGGRCAGKGLFLSLQGLGSGGVGCAHAWGGGGGAEALRGGRRAARAAAAAAAACTLRVHTCKEGARPSAATHAHPGTMGIDAGARLRQRGKRVRCAAGPEGNAGRSGRCPVIMRARPPPPRLTRECTRCSWPAPCHHGGARSGVAPPPSSPLSTS